MNPGRTDSGPLPVAGAGSGHGPAEAAACRAVLITGAASGIGRAVALQLAAAGVGVALVDRDGDGAGETAQAARASARADVVAVEADVSEGDQVAAAVAHAADRLGPLGGLVCAAGMLEPGSLADTTARSWQRHFDVNTTGVLHCLQHARTRLSDGGSVVVVSSNAARVPRLGMLAYSASKAATSALTRAAGLELAERGIRCNVVEPGSTDTPMQHALWTDPETGRESVIRGDPDRYRLGIPLGRLADPADVAATVVFLLSPAARHITLQQLYVDGGASL